MNNRSEFDVEAGSSTPDSESYPKVTKKNDMAHAETQRKIPSLGWRMVSLSRALLRDTVRHRSMLEDSLAKTLKRQKDKSSNLKAKIGQIQVHALTPMHTGC